MQTLDKYVVWCCDFCLHLVLPKSETGVNILSEAVCNTIITVKFNNMWYTLYHSVQLVARQWRHTCCTNCKDDLQRIKEEEHDKQRNGCADGQEHRLARIDGLNIWNTDTDTVTMTNKVNKCEDIYSTLIHN